MTDPRNQKSGPSNTQAGLEVRGTVRKHYGARAFGKALQAIAPGATGEELAALFGNRVARQTVIRWRDGQRAAPQWARDIVARRLRAFAELERAIQAEPMGVAPPNIVAFNARRRELAKAKGAPLGAP